MTQGALPEAVRQAALRAAARPVRPAAAPWRRAGLTVGLGLGAGLAGLALFGLRSNASALGLFSVAGPAVLRSMAGALLLALAMREGIPGEGPPRPLRLTVLLFVPPLLVLWAEWLSRAGGHEAEQLGPLGCYLRALLLALPASGLAAWLLSRAHPLHPVFATTSGVLGAALLADAAMHLVCPVTARMHTLLVHGGAVATLTAAAALLGWRVRKRRERGVL